MKFRTELVLSTQEPSLLFPTRIMAIGSCFAQNIGTYLQRYKFPMCLNPLGIVYHPLGILDHLAKIQLAKTEVTSRQSPSGYWHSFDFHSELSRPHKAEFEQGVIEKVQAAHDFWLNTELLIITWGTAWVYRHKTTGKYVANCHKYPQADFTKELLEVEEILAGYDTLMGKLPEKCSVVLTVSPIRHIKDSLPLNSVSKSILRVAAHKLSEQYASVSYFPSYEIMMDDLRDYRFYGEDMLHPNSFAQAYIWDKFTHQYFGSEALDWMDTWGKILKQLGHRPLQENSPGYKEFLGRLHKQLVSLSATIDCLQELAMVEARLNGLT